MLPRVNPKPLNLRTCPRSTVSVPVHCVEHQFVDALPSIALPAGEPDCSLDAVAMPVKATLSANPGPGCGSADAAFGTTDPPGSSDVSATAMTAAPIAMSDQRN